MWDKITHEVGCADLHQVVVHLATNGLRAEYSGEICKSSEGSRSPTHTQISRYHQQCLNLALGRDSFRILARITLFAGVPL